jgi:hypothetical protein
MSAGEAMAAGTSEGAAAGGRGDKRKRRVALVFGYVGTKYFGLQKAAPDSGQDVVTIESVLEEALYKVSSKDRVVLVV